MAVVRRVVRVFFWLLALVIALLLVLRLAAWAREDGAPVPPTAGMVATPLGTPPDGAASAAVADAPAI